MSSYWKRAKTASPALLESLLDVAERESSLEVSFLKVEFFEKIDFRHVNFW